MKLKVRVTCCVPLIGWNFQRRTAVCTVRSNMPRGRALTMSMLLTLPSELTVKVITTSPEAPARWASGGKAGCGVLMATSLIVGESLFGVLFAGVVAATNKDTPLAVVAANPLAVPLGLIVFTALALGLYIFTRREAAIAAGPDEHGTIPPHEAAIR